MAAWHTRGFKQGSDGFPPATWHLAASRQNVTSNLAVSLC